MATAEGSTTASNKKPGAKEDVEYEFVRTGERQRLNEIMSKRLKEAGWTSRVEELCKDVIAKKGLERVSVEDIIAEVRDPARRMVSDEVKKELMESIRQFVYDNTDLSSAAQSETGRGT